MHYLVAYGLLLPFTLLGIQKMIRAQKERGWFLAGWLAVFPILIYLPMTTQRRMAEGIWLVFVIGALYTFSAQGKMGKLAKAYFSLAFLSSLVIILGSITVALNPEKPAFRPSTETKLYQYIAKNADSDSVVLSSFEIGNNLPAWAPVRVVIGHGPETINRNRIDKEIEDSFSVGMSPEKSPEIFQTYNVDYLVWGPLEMKAWEWDPATSSDLILDYKVEELSLYKITNH
jgi:hypothetical protein